MRNDKLSGTSAVSTGCERGMEAAGGRKLAQERLAAFWGFFFPLMRQRREKFNFPSFSIIINYALALSAERRSAGAGGRRPGTKCQ